MASDAGITFVQGLQEDERMNECMGCALICFELSTNKKRVVNLATIAADISLFAHVTFHRVFGGGGIIRPPHECFGAGRAIISVTLLARFFAAFSTRRMLRMTVKTFFDNKCPFFSSRTVIAAHIESVNDMSCQSLTLDTLLLFILSTRRTKLVTSRGRSGNTY